MTLKALVVGALGVVGRGLVSHMLDLPDWEVAALSRRAMPARGRLQSVSLDLLDRAQCEGVLPTLSDVTHVFYVAYAPRATHAEEVEPNLRMLQNLLDVLGPAAKGLRHVTLMQGTKAYGAHLGPYKTPARETDLRIISPLFYFPQQDFLAGRAAEAGWRWSVMRPRCIWGFSVGSPMNMITALGAYAAISRELALPLCFPGTMGGYRRIDQAVDTALLAKACVWAATAERCANQIFNVANGGLFRWQDMWPLIADDAEAAAARGIPVTAVRIASVALSGAVGAAIGFAAGQLTFAYFALGFMLTLNGFIALAIGGLGSTAGAIVGGLLLGLLTSFTTFLFGGAFQNSISTGVLVLVLLVLPAGFFGRRGIRAV